MYCISLYDRQSVQWIGSYPGLLDGVVVAGGRRQNDRVQVPRGVRAIKIFPKCAGGAESLQFWDSEE